MLKIHREGKRLTYIYTKENENIPLLTLENGSIIIEKHRISSPEVALLLASALRHAVGMLNIVAITGKDFEELEKFWAEEYESAYVRESSA
ncbi:MAG: hypothetical protein J7J91_10540 [Deltaproteobacteria bacterium]|nr:hypothetical protein [Deltaproteobacteria bacterium]